MVRSAATVRARTGPIDPRTMSAMTDDTAPRRSVWRDRDFVRLWSAGTISVFGSLITRIGVAVRRDPAARRRADRDRDPPLARARSPGCGVGLFAGAWVDRLPRRPMMIVTDLGRAALLGSIPLAAAAGVLRIEQLYVVTFLASILSTFFNVADRSYLPTLVDSERLVAANSALTASASVAEFSAFSISGFLIQLFSAPMAIAVDAVSFLASALFLGSIRRPEPPRPAVADREPVLHEIREGTPARRPAHRSCGRSRPPAPARTSCGACSGRPTCCSPPTSSG